MPYAPVIVERGEKRTGLTWDNDHSNSSGNARGSLLEAIRGGVCPSLPPPLRYHDEASILSSSDCISSWRDKGTRAVRGIHVGRALYLFGHHRT